MALLLVLFLVVVLFLLHLLLILPVVMVLLLMNPALSIPLLGRVGMMMMMTMLESL